ncbi:hypothetical protein HYPSUDRAFT_138928, partial [Hypholoma sublateritium FD-334 SS-4]
PQRRQLWLATVSRVHPATDSMGRPHIPIIPDLDVRTRWGSTHDMLQCAIMYESSIRHFVEANYRIIGTFDLSSDDWKDIKLIAGWLQMFRLATAQMSATSIPMISTAHAVFRGLQDQLKHILVLLPTNVSPSVHSGILSAHRKLSDYFTKFDESPYYTWAAILDPRITYTELEADYAGDTELLEGLEHSKTALHDHFMRFYARSQPSAPLEEYLRLPPQEFISCNPMRWWYAQRERFPNLYKLARNVLAIPGSAVAVERLFSGGRDTIALRRASLHPDTIRILMILKQHIRVRESQKAK